ncbi:hypothetical protein [Streptomyces sp. NPDC096311]|uniref:hypothetical protein n=1 Tax=Streptomyces sp. NPDC096311 TaxID=3366083 RepID=UPI0037F98988
MNTSNNAGPLMRGEIDVHAGLVCCGECSMVIDAMAAGSYPLDRRVSMIPMSDIAERGFDGLGSGGVVKVFVDLEE